MTDMKKTVLILTTCLWMLATSMVAAQELKSPDGNLELQFSLAEDGTPLYSLQYKNREVVEPSALGFILKNDENSFRNNFEVVETTVESFDETWEPVWGEESGLRNHYNSETRGLKKL